MNLAASTPAAAPWPTRLKRLARVLWQSLQRLFRQEVLVLGDSHAMVFQHAQLRAAFPRLFFNVHAVGAATLSGLKNANSATQALPAFRHALRHSRARLALIQLGEVDTGFVIWSRAQRLQVPVEQMLADALQNYFDLIEEVRQTHEVVCISAPLPTIADEQDWGEVAAARKSVTASQLARTRLTLTLNERVQAHCRQVGVDCIALDQESLGANGLVAPSLLNPDPLDHHYDLAAYVRLLLPHLRRVLPH
jgi:hypothetical protein